MERNKSSLYNAIVSFFGMILIMITNLILIRLILINYGSDANGILSTVTQTVTLLTLIEAGMTLAINVSLYKPYINEDKEKLEAILLAATRVFYLVGIIFLIIGILFSVVYPFFVKSEIPMSTITLIYLFNIIPMAINYGLTTKYRIMLQVAQKEYIVNIITHSCNLLTFIANFLVIFLGGSLIHLCISTMVVGIIRCLLIYIPYKKYFSHINTKYSKPDYTAIKGSWDVLFQRITSAIYSAMPIIFISVFVNTSMASVYMVYASVFSIIKQATYSFIHAPQQGFGHLLAEKGSRYLIRPFNEYQLIVVIVLNCLLATATVLILPFIELYTSGITDVEYYNWNLVIIFILITCLEIIHVPSGILINLSRNFRASRNIQIVACLSMIIFGYIGGTMMGMIGILIGKLICNIVLVLLEIWYAHRFVLKIKTTWYIKILTLNVCVFLLCFITNNYINMTIVNYADFIMAGSVYLLITCILVFAVNYLFYKSELNNIFNRINLIFSSFKKMKLKGFPTK